MIQRFTCPLGTFEIDLSKPPRIPQDEITPEVIAQRAREVRESLGHHLLMDDDDGWILKRGPSGERDGGG